MTLSKSEKIKVEKEKKRIPVPQKPPKVEEGKRRYKRIAVKKETIKIIKKEEEN
jgi:hypothetical protein